MEKRILPTTRAIRIAVSTAPIPGKNEIQEPAMPPYGDSLLAAEGVLAKARQLASSGTALIIRVWLSKQQILSFGGDPVDSVGSIAKLFNRIRSAGWADVEVKDESVKPTKESKVQS